MDGGGRKKQKVESRKAEMMKRDAGSVRREV
jgi:hypothetical protein